MSIWTRLIGSWGYSSPVGCTKLSLVSFLPVESIPTAFLVLPAERGLPTPALRDPPAPAGGAPRQLLSGGLPQVWDGVSLGRPKPYDSKLLQIMLPIDEWLIHGSLCVPLRHLACDQAV